MTEKLSTRKAATRTLTRQDGPDEEQLKLLSEPWRAVCPAGHRSWEHLGNDYYCHCCEEHFDDVHDAKNVETPENPMQRGSD